MFISFDEVFKYIFIVCCFCVLYIICVYIVLNIYKYLLIFYVF